MRTRIVFEQVKRHSSKRVKCANGCGRYLTRHKTFMQTLNPFNKNARGEVKTREEILRELANNIKIWHRQKVICKACENKIMYGPASHIEIKL